MHFHLRRLVVCSSLVVLFTLPRQLSADDAFQPMFNGEDLSGWVLTNTPSETWSFQDDMLVCTGAPIGELRTEKMYQNFVMELEWRHMAPRGNAGIFVWADDITARGVPFHRGVEVQVLENAYGNSKGHTTHGDIFPIHGATMTPINGRGGSRAFPTENRSRPSPEWNHYRIECRDGEISLAVNGKVVTRGKDCLPRKGYICLESEGGIVHYRNVRISELPSTDLTAQQIAIANRGYRSLYTGLNLNGWKAAGTGSHWESKNWVLAFHGSNEVSGTLRSTESFKNVGFVVDVRLKDKSSRTSINAGPTMTIDLNAPEIAKHLETVGRWNRIESGVRSGKRWLTINGNQIAMTAAVTSDSAAAFSLMPTGPVDFCNIYARSLNVDE
ncbi:MAG: family 16 glycoside hydrolase [Fuerstiella sp.]